MSAGIDERTATANAAMVERIKAAQRGHLAAQKVLHAIREGREGGAEAIEQARAALGDDVEADAGVRSQPCARSAAMRRAAKVVSSANDATQAELADVGRKLRDTLRARCALLGEALRIVPDAEHGEVYAMGKRRFVDADALETWLDERGAA